MNVYKCVNSNWIQEESSMCMKENWRPRNAGYSDSNLKVMLSVL